jgi:hypothetical protein
MERLGKVTISAVVYIYDIKFCFTA